ncbi:hypothetical protein [Ruficoccus sp. ZRK36]|uniref:hypothetical protein n=1 Tax=Ruficoccus sp. ZRK36 TaxID=2866311 RepID=UPI001C73D188|nr:hypothetical protein [Ruficoccus sp. ZRK36]QYY37460.1 hypothetical protein K0V07_08220 [Ruficoccus sp. ZRK36]
MIFRNLLIGLLLGGALGYANEGDLLSVWQYDTPGDYRFHVVPDNVATIDSNTGEVTPGGEKAVAISLVKLVSGALPWDIQFSCDYDGALSAGKSYEVSFACRATVPGVIKVCSGLRNKPFTPIAGSMADIDVTEDWRTVSFRFTVDQDWQPPLTISRMMLADYGEPSTLYIGPISLRELPSLLPLAVEDEWVVCLDADKPMDVATFQDGFATSKGEASPMLVTATEGDIDLAALAGESQEKRSAILYNEFYSPSAGKMRIGVSADWWMEIFVNGKSVYSTLAAGNLSNSFTVNDHVVEFPVMEGVNLLAVRVLSGSEGWRFTYGVPTRAPDEVGLYVVRPSHEWKPVNMGAYIVKAGTALDFSRLLGEPVPAGTFGRLIVSEEGNLAFENAKEKPVRFISFNCMLSKWRKKVHTWTKQDIENYADAIARQGYNMVRLHFNERFLLGYKIHDTPHRTLAETGIPESASEIPFDEENYERFEYLIYCLKMRGIYVNLDLMGSHGGYTLAYPSKVASENSFRVQLLINPEYRKHWYQAIEYLLTRANPYTGLSLKDDPMIALVEPLNEQDLRLYDKGMMAALTPAFTEYLKSKYGTDKALQEAWGEASVTFATVPDIDETILRKGDTRSDDAGTFLIDTMSEMTKWYYDSLRQIGYNGLISQWDMIMRTMEIPVRALMPVIAQHSYFSHPTHGIPTKNLAQKSMNWRYTLGNPDYDVMVVQESSLNSSYFRASAAARFLDRPFLITEYSHSSFNRYRHERGLYFGAYAAFQDWDCLTAHGELAAVRDTTAEPLATFESAVDPISKASETVAALAFLRRDVGEAKHSVEFPLTRDLLFPQHFLAAISDDYAKLSMLTKIGISYNQVEPLMPVGVCTPTLQIVPEDFSPLQVTTWYVKASSSDSNMLPSLVQDVREAGILSGQNKTNAEEHIYQSDTEEIILDAQEETMTVISPRLEGAIVKEDVPVQLDRMHIDSCSKPASIVLASLNRDQDIRDADRLLLVLATNALNDGMTFERPNMVLLAEVGQLPVLMESVQCEIKIETSQSTLPRVFALNMDGTRSEEISSKLRDGKLIISLDTAKLEYGTPYFEIVYSEK